MLNDLARKKAEKLLDAITREISGEYNPGTDYDITLTDIRWLAKTLIEVDNNLKPHEQCLYFPLHNCTFVMKSQIQEIQ